jgi:hypothetical protein
MLRRLAFTVSFLAGGLMFAAGLVLLAGVGLVVMVCAAEVWT